MLFQPLGQLLGDHGFHHRAHLGRDQLVLGLRGEFRIRHLDRQHAGHAFAHVVARQRHLLLLGDAGIIGVIVDGAGQRGAQARQMGAAVALRDVVGEAQTRLVIGVGPFHRHFHGHAVPLARHHDRRIVQRALGAVEIGDEGLDAALVMQVDLDLFGVAAVDQLQIDPRIEEGQLAQAVFQRGEVEFGLGEGGGRGEEGHLGAGARALLGLRRRADHFEGLDGVAMGEAHVMFGAVAPDAQIQPFRQRVHHRDADAVQAARYLVGILVELTAGMQLGHDDLGRRDALFLVDVDRDAAAIVAHADRAVAIQLDLDLVAPAGQAFVDGVVDHLIDHVMQARPVIGVADIHAGTLAHGVQPAQHLDAVSAIIRRRGLAAGIEIILGRDLIAHGLNPLLPRFRAAGLTATTA